MLTYKAMYKFVEDGVHAEILDFPGVITFGTSQDECVVHWQVPLSTWRRRTCCWASPYPVLIPA